MGDVEDDAPSAKRRQPAAPPPPGLEDGGGEGRHGHISNLPEAILGDIMSLLPTKEAARNRILASSWRRLWPSAPLNLDCHGFLRDDGTIDFRGDPGEYLENNAITHILAIHQGPARRVRIPAHHMQPGHRNALDGWLMSPALDSLQELEFYHRCDYDNLVAVSVWPPPPASITRFSSTLHVATLSHCEISECTGWSFRFPSLKMLALEEVVYTETSVQYVLDGCPALENLLLRGNVGAARVRIVSPTIRSIAVYVSSFRGGAHLEELIVEDAPRLERLLRTLPDTDLRVTVTKAPRLETLGCLTDGLDATKLKLGSAVIWRDEVKFTEAVCSVKILAFSNYALSLDMVIKFMECFPCLERLYIKSCVSRENNLWRRKHKDLIKRHDIRLKNLVLGNYRGTKSEIKFATFFILNAGLLESMRFEVHRGICIDGSWNEDQRRQLLVEKRASRRAQFDFSNCGGRCNFRDVLNQNVHNLSLADPFACRC